MERDCARHARRATKQPTWYPLAPGTRGVPNNACEQSTQQQAPRMQCVLDEADEENAENLFLSHVCEHVGHAQVLS